jgi:hypothetical protein
MASPEIKLETRRKGYGERNWVGGVDGCKSRVRMEEKMKCINEMKASKKCKEI